MYEVNEKTISTIEIKNSKFITIIDNIYNQENINSYINKIKKEYPKATHYCYAYIIDDIKKSSDDGEPGGTAGTPILNILEKNNLNNVICIVVRYFGGIKLGAGGLVRAYSKSVKETLDNTALTELIDGYKIKIIFPYEKEQEINYLLKTSTITNKEYTDNITYIVLLTEEILNILKEKNITLEIKERLKIKKI